MMPKSGDATIPRFSVLVDEEAESGSGVTCDEQADTDCAETYCA